MEFGESMDTQLLNVYRASAGSGKTYRLAVEYLKLLVDDPTAYRHILAVTFTNKATNEMKTRILSQLYGISNGLADSDSYVDTLRKEGSWDEATIRLRCGLALRLMMHDYGRFNITTIDSFFQIILRQLIQELDLPSNLRVDLDSNGVLAEAVVQLMDDMTKDKELLNNVLSFVDAKMEVGHHWNVRNDLNEFGKNIFSEQYQEHGSEVRASLRDRKAIARYRQTLRTHRQNLMQDLSATADRFFATCHEVGLEETDLTKSTPRMFEFFAKLQSGNSLPNVGARILQRAEDGAAWLNKDKCAQWADIAQEHLVPLLAHVVEILQSPEFPTLNVVDAHLHQLSLLGDIDNEVRRINEDACRFLLADTALVLNQLIAGSDVPFIYERIGTRIDHVMIDEMQDTSRMQWKNFKPLIQNSLSAGHRCLLVGDVKQSIYRWRNGDWSILNKLEEDPDFGGQIAPIPGNKNFRSYGHVVDFNNRFFLAASRLLADELTERGADLRKAYDEQTSGQTWEGDVGGRGYVRVELLQEGMNYEERAAAEAGRVWLAVQELLAKGVRSNDIAILVKKKRFATDIISYFQQQTDGERVEIVSGEAYQLDSSRAIRILIQALRVTVFPNAPLHKALLKHMMEEEGLADSEWEWPSVLRPCETNATPLPLRELCAELVVQLHLREEAEQDAYLFYFFDQLSLFIEDKGGDTEQFLHYWDETLHALTIPADKLNGVRILTIHKAKGLEFGSVIVPFCEWELQADKRNMLWCEAHAEPYNQMPLLPVSCENAALNSIFREDVLDENMKSYVDNLNVLYVAFTRAVKNLIVIGGRESRKKGEKTNIFSLLNSVLQNMAEEEVCRMSKEDDIDIDIDIYELGTIVAESEGNKASDNILLQEMPTNEVHFEYKHNRQYFIQSNDSAKFILQNAEEEAGEGKEDAAHRQHYIDEGLVFHSLMASIRTLEDVPMALRHLNMQGVCPYPEQRERIAALLRKAFDNEQARDWFDPRWAVTNEQDILCPEADGHAKPQRPDRVMTDGQKTVVIDYKTGQPKQRHGEQVKNYVELLRRMGYEQVSGYLWYVDSGQIILCP